MHYLVIVRHGSYSGPEGRLSQRGQREIAELAAVLSRMLSGLRTVVVSSTAARCFETAVILGLELDAEVTGHDVLYSSEKEGRHAQPEEATVCILEHGKHAEATIVVTHYEYTEELPAYFGRTRLGTEFPSEALAPGHAWLIDCQAKTLCELP